MHPARLSGFWIAVCCALILIAGSGVAGRAAIGSIVAHQDHAGPVDAAAHTDSHESGGSDMSDPHCHPTIDCLVTTALPAEYAALPFFAPHWGTHRLANSRFLSVAVSPSPPPPRSLRGLSGKSMQTRNGTHGTK